MNPKRKAVLCGALCKAKGAKSPRPTPDQLAVINERYAHTPLAEEDVYVRKVYLCHNAVDRDGDRFSETILDDFARTLPGKGLFKDHNHSTSTTHLIGRFFEAGIEEESPAEASARTGEALKLPDGVEKVKWVVGWFYIPLIDEIKKEVVNNIDAGLLSFVSIGFDAAGMRRIRDQENPDSTLYYEYEAPGETAEGSIVWLGAQPGASIAKKANEEKPEPKKEKKKMEKVKAMLGLSPDASEEAVMEAVKKMGTDNERMKLLDTLEVSDATDAEAVKAAAEVGRKAREAKTNAIVAASGKLGREVSDSYKARLASMSYDELDDELKFLDNQVAKEFSSKAQTSSGGDSNDAETGKGYLDELTKLKEDGMSHYDAVMKLNKTRPGAFTDHVAAGMNEKLN